MCRFISWEKTKTVALRSRSASPRISKSARAIFKPAIFQLEANLKRHFNATRVRGEWFDIEPADILPFLQRAGRDGFVAKNADAFEISGYDRDAVPEYLGVWEWANLEMEECCPFCGCLGGMHFQDASQMYYCISCDTLTDFSELDPPDEEPKE